MTTSTPKLQSYIWEGLNTQGEKIKGVQNAASIALLRVELRSKGIVPKKIKKKSSPLFSVNTQKIRPADITYFSRQLATMLASGIPLVQSFEIVSRGQNNPNLQGLITSIKTDVESGSSLTEALTKHPKYFNGLFCNLVNAGEQSGSLVNMLERIATYKEKVESLKGKIKGALFYPAIVISIALLITAGLLIFVVPQFESLFNGYGAQLPTFTQVVINASEFVQAFWWLIFGGIFFGIWFTITSYKRSPTFRETIDKLSLKIPKLGSIIQKAAIARFARTLSITFAAGMPLVDALQAVAGSTGNVVYQKATLKIKKEVSTGQQMQTVMRNLDVFPNMVTQMIAIGEESGNLELMLTKVADFYEEEVDNAVNNLSKLLEPIIMVVIGILVGGLVIAMYLPIFKLGSVI